MHGRFDHKCPHCLKQIKERDIHDWHTADYSSCFERDCPNCGKSIEVIVHSVPEFELCKAETSEEYQARRAKIVESMKDET